MDTNCRICADLWREYSTATHAHVAVESKLEVARLNHDHTIVQRLLPEVHAASDRRTECRRQVEEHERQAHSNGATAAQN